MLPIFHFENLFFLQDCTRAPLMEDIKLTNMVLVKDPEFRDIEESGNYYILVYIKLGFQGNSFDIPKCMVGLFKAIHNFRNAINDSIIKRG